MYATTILPLRHIAYVNRLCPLTADLRSEYRRVTVGSSCVLCALGKRGAWAVLIIATVRTRQVTRGWCSALANSSLRCSSETGEEKKVECPSPRICFGWQEFFPSHTWHFFLAHG
jgi:hypothetical protein